MEAKWNIARPIKESQTSESNTKNKEWRCFCKKHSIKDRRLFVFYEWSHIELLIYFSDQYFGILKNWSRFVQKNYCLLLTKITPSFYLLLMLYRVKKPYCVCDKHIAHFNCLCSSPCFSANHAQDFGIVNQCSWFWKSFIIVDCSGEFSFFQGIKIDIRNGIFISIQPTTTKFGKQVHLEELTHMRLTGQVLLMSSSQDHETN